MTLSWDDTRGSRTTTDTKTTAALAVTVGMAVFLAAVPSANARRLYAGGGVGQHATVMNSIAQARQQNNATINQVQNNIRASQQRPY